jgi:chorismate mutase
MKYLILPFIAVALFSCTEESPENPNPAVEEQLNVTDTIVQVDTMQTETVTSPIVNNGLSEEDKTALKSHLKNNEIEMLTNAVATFNTTNNDLEVVQLGELNKIDLLRAGIWKPRTRPNTFEGIGEKALPWLKNAGIAIDTPVCAEIANASHVDAALKAGIDVLWLGARTTVNPFSVQEIADALKGVDIPVMVKNPINPDLELWMGGIERIQLAGIKNITAVHRGFSSFEKTVYRNVPMWEIPIELKMRMPDIPIVCDPSHICGSRDLLAAVSQKAMDLAMDGLMIESHVSPMEAWSDAAQQITPKVLGEMLNSIVSRHEVDSTELIGKLEKFRSEIDQLDEKIIQIFAKRMAVAREIGDFKKANDITILQTERWKEIHNARKEMATKLGLSEPFIEVLLTAIHKESINQQNDVMND